MLSGLERPQNTDLVKKAVHVPLIPLTEYVTEGALAGCDGGLSALDINSASSSPHTLTSTPLTPHSLIVPVSSSHFAVFEPGGVVSLRDAIYGTCQASMETGLLSVTMVTLVIMML